MLIIRDNIALIIPKGTILWEKDRILTRVVQHRTNKLLNFYKKFIKKISQSK